MTYPYLLISDLHFHAWSAFAGINSDGINSRLAIQIEEVRRAAADLRANGGSEIIIAGDIFHERGKIKPSVFNPVHALFKELADDDFHVIAIPGNHDLEGRDTTKIGNAFQTLSALPNFTVVTNAGGVLGGLADGVAMIPWCSSYDELRKAATSFLKKIEDRRNIDLIIHAGINGVIAGLPDHGLDAAEVAAWGFRRVFAGHYHNYKVMEAGRVISIGAMTHQQWSDVGTRAGYLLMWADGFKARASNAPSFIEINEDTDPDDYPLLVDRNYVRVRGLKLTDRQVNEMREALVEMGALGVTFNVTREVVSTRSGSVVGAGMTLDQSVSKYVEELKTDHEALVKSRCADILNKVRALSA